jgi:hypothetical protein
MASIRNLKKKIDELIFEVIADCFTFSGIHTEDKNEKAKEIINDAVNLRNDLIARVNNPEGKDNPKIVKSYFKTIEKDLYSGADSFFERLSSLSSSKKT